MPRLLDNWFQAYGDWTVHRSESPESLIMWAGLYTVASVAKRNVRFPKSLMGSYEIYPNLYVIYVGPPGVVRKSTTAGYAEKLLRSEELENITLSSSATSASKLIEDMSETPDYSMSIISSELGIFMSVSQDEMYDLLIDLYDNRDIFTYATRSHGLEIIEEPCLNFLAATTPSWVSEQMPLHVIGGGFTSRCIFLFENQVRQRRLYYRGLDQRKLRDLRAKLEHDLSHIAGLSGEFRHESDDLANEMEHWYRTTTDVEVDERLEGYFNRRHVHLHKVMMLLSLCERDDLVVTKTHFEVAKKLLDDVELKMPRAFSAVGRNPYSDIILQVGDFIKAHNGEPVPYKKLRQKFYHNLQEVELKEVLGTLTVTGEIEYVSSDAGGGTRGSYKSV